MFRDRDYDHYCCTQYFLLEVTLLYGGTCFAAARRGYGSTLRNLALRYSYSALSFEYSTLHVHMVRNFQYNSSSKLPTLSVTNIFKGLSLSLQYHPIFRGRVLQLIMFKNDNNDKVYSMSFHLGIVKFLDKVRSKVEGRR